MMADENSRMWWIDEFMGDDDENMSKDIQSFWDILEETSDSQQSSPEVHSIEMLQQDDSVPDTMNNGCSQNQTVRRSERLKTSSIRQKTANDSWVEVPPTRTAIVDESLPHKPFRQKSRNHKFREIMWKPEGMEKGCPTRWECYPGRSTFFLEILAGAKRAGRFPKGPPTSSIYDELTMKFWNVYKVYHTVAQFKNHYHTKKSLWSLVCDLRAAIGTSWDEERKMVLANKQWWDEHKYWKKNINTLNGKPVPDYDLLEYVFTGQHAEGAYLHDPSVPRFPLQPDVVRHSTDETEEDNAESNNVTMENVDSIGRHGKPPTSSTGRRSQKKRSKEKRSESLLGMYAREFMVNFFEVANEVKEKRKGEKDKSSVSDLRSHQSKHEMVVDILIDEMKMDVTSDLFQATLKLLDSSPWYTPVLLKLPANTRWAWLMKTLSPQCGCPSGAGTSEAQEEYDLNRTSKK